MKTMRENDFYVSPEVVYTEPTNFYEYVELDELTSSSTPTNNTDASRSAFIADALAEIDLITAEPSLSLADQMISKYKKELAEEKQHTRVEPITNVYTKELPKEKPLSLADQMISKYKKELAEEKQPLPTKQAAKQQKARSYDTEAPSFADTIVSRYKQDLAEEKLVKSDNKSTEVSRPELPKKLNSDITTKEAKEQFSGSFKRVAKQLGIIVGVAAFSATSLIGASELMQPNNGARFKETSASAEPTKETPEPVTVSTLQSAPTTAVAEAPKPIQFEAKPGELIGVLNIPGICEDIQILEFSEKDKIDGLIGTGQAMIDKKIVDPTPNVGCGPVDAYEKDFESRTGSNYIDRTERVRNSATSADNAGGQVNHWQPIAGHEQREDGIATSVYPGQPGNSVIAGHGSTYSAPLADMGSLKAGDTATFSRADGRIYTYTMAEAEILSNNDFSQFTNYTNPKNESTMTIYMCSDSEGRTGSSAQRYATRWVLVHVTNA